MQVDTTTLSYIENVVTTAKMFGIDSVIFETDRVRGMHEDGTVALLHTENVPTLAVGSIGLNRIDLFLSRYNIAKMGDKFEVSVTPNNVDTPTFARSLTMKAKGVKVDFRCANPATIRAVKAFAGDCVKYRARMQPEAVVHMIKGTTAMSTDKITLEGSKDKIALKMIDINGDELEYIFGDGVDKMQPDDNADPKFSFTYPVKQLQTLFKGNSDSYFVITLKGFIRMPVNGLNIYIPPKV